MKPRSGCIYITVTVRTLQLFRKKNTVKIKDFFTIHQCNLIKIHISCMYISVCTKCLKYRFTSVYKKHNSKPLCFFFLTEIRWLFKSLVSFFHFQKCFILKIKCNKKPTQTSHKLSISQLYLMTSPKKMPSVNYDDVRLT